jgi:hypothetical protein
MWSHKFCERFEKWCAQAWKGTWASSLDWWKGTWASSPNWVSTWQDNIYWITSEKWEKCSRNGCLVKVQRSHGTIQEAQAQAEEATWQDNINPVDIHTSHITIQEIQPEIEEATWQEGEADEDTWQKDEAADDIFDATVDREVDDHNKV